VIPRLPLADIGSPPPGSSPSAPPAQPPVGVLEHHCTTSDLTKVAIIMSEEAQKARQALQESMDLRDQGHSDE
jgi:hypothetical protein